ncbi:MAG: phosphopantothenoylcysteine decarboxylase [Armatimonadota bacterium]
MHPPSLAGRRLLITAGPTWVPLDAVRYLGNTSSGRTGVTIARRAAELGAEVTLLLGPVQEPPAESSLAGACVRRYVTFDDLHTAVRELAGSGRFDAMIHAAAVSDYLPANVETGKIPSAGELTLRLVPAPKIVDEVKRLDPKLVLVKFKLEVARSRDELIRIASRSRERSRAELIVANDLTGLTADRHPALILDEHGVQASVETNAELAERLLELLVQRLQRGTAGLPPNGGLV